MNNLQPLTLSNREGTILNKPNTPIHYTRRIAQPAEHPPNSTNRIRSSGSGIPAISFAPWALKPKQAAACLKKSEHQATPQQTLTSKLAYYAMPFHAMRMLRCTIGILHYTIPCYALPYWPYSAMLDDTGQSCISYLLLSDRRFCCAMHCCATLYFSLFFSSIQFYSALFDESNSWMVRVVPKQQAPSRFTRTYLTSSFMYLKVEPTTAPETF